MRAMRDNPRLKFDLPAVSSRELPSVSERFFAVYEHSGERIYISENGLFLASIQAYILYTELAGATCFHDGEVLLDAVVLQMNDGRSIRLNVSGHDGRVHDAHAFVRFLMRTLEDRLANASAVEAKRSVD